MTSVSAAGTTAKVMRLEPSEPTVACTRALPGLTPVSTPVAASTVAVGSTETQVTAAAALSPFLSSGLAPSWMDSPTSMLSGPGTRTSIPTTPAWPSVQAAASHRRQHAPEREPSPHSVSGAGLPAMSRSAVSACRIHRSASGPLGGRARNARRCSAACWASPRLSSRKATP